MNVDAATKSSKLAMGYSIHLQLILFLLFLIGSWRVGKCLFNLSFLSDKMYCTRGKSLSRWVRNRDSCRLPRQIAIFDICRDSSRQYTFSAISRDFLWFSASDFDFIYSLTVKFLGFLPSEADLTSRYKS